MKVEARFSIEDTSPVDITSYFRLAGERENKNTIPYKYSVAQYSIPINSTNAGKEKKNAHLNIKTHEETRLYGL